MFILTLTAALAEPVLLDAVDGAVSSTTDVQIATVLTGQVATTTVTTTFSPLGHARALYGMPLPEGAVATSITVDDGTDLETAGVSEGADAELADTVPGTVRSTLGTFLGENPLVLDLGPYTPGTTLAVTTTYVELLPFDRGEIRWSYDTTPFPGDVESVPLSHQVSFDPGREVLQTEGEGSRSGTFDRGETLNWSWEVAADDVTAQLYTYRPEQNPFVDEDEGYFLLLVEPPAEADVIPKDFTYVLDTSGSMSGGKLADAQASARRGLAGLNPDDRFEALAFSKRVRRFRAGWSGPGVADVASDWVDDQSADGGTNLEAAVMAALGTPTPSHGCVPALAAPSAHPHVVLLLTDGKPTEGITSTAEILAEARSANQHDAVIYPVAIGASADRGFLQALAEDHRGVAVEVDADDDLDQALEELFERINHPMLLRPEMTGLPATSTHPEVLPDLFLGQQLIILGRYTDAGPAEVTVAGEVERNRVDWSWPVELADRDDAHPFVAKLWARAEVDHLLAELAASEDEDADLVDEITELGLAYRLDTPYTRFGMGGLDGVLDPYAQAGGAQAVGCGCQILESRGAWLVLLAGLVVARRRREHSGSSLA